MKIWVENPYPDDNWLIGHFSEPQWDSLMDIWHSGSGVDMYEEAIAKVLKLPRLKNHELAEIDLSGKSPKLVCIWEPA